MMSSRMLKKIEIAFPDSTYEELKEYADEKGMTPAEAVVDFVRRGLAGIFIWEDEEDLGD